MPFKIEAVYPQLSPLAMLLIYSFAFGQNIVLGLPDSVDSVSSRGDL